MCTNHYHKMAYKYIEDVSSVVVGKMEGEVLDAYRDLSIPGAYTGLDNFYKTNQFAGKKRIQKELFKSKRYCLHYPANKKIKRRHVYVPTLNDQVGMDLLDIQKYSKSNYNKRYILVVLDFYSKMAWMEPIKRKTCVEVRD